MVIWSSRPPTLMSILPLIFDPPAPLLKPSLSLSRSLSVFVGSFFSLRFARAAASLSSLSIEDPLLASLSPSLGA